MSDLLRIDGYFAPVRETDWEELNKAFAKWYTRKGYRFYGITWPTTEERMWSENDGPAIPSGRVPYTVEELRNVVNMVLETERESHRLWDDSFTNVAFSNLSETTRKAYIQQCYEATRKHAEAVKLLEALLVHLTDTGGGASDA